jgi:hypothetical protein
MERLRRCLLIFVVLATTFFIGVSISVLVWSLQTIS